MSKKILLTGFKPFLSESINPSEILTKKICELRSDIDGVILPVSYEHSFLKLEHSLMNNENYQGLIMLGQAGGRNSVSLERVALNWSENSLADADGVTLPAGPIVENAPSSYINHVFPTSWRDELNKIGPTAISFSAGTYVYNSLYYKILHRLRGQSFPAFFVHVPYLPEQVQERPGTASMALNLQLQIILTLIDLMKTLNFHHSGGRH